MAPRLRPGLIPVGGHLAATNPDRLLGFVPDDAFYYFGVAEHVREGWWFSFDGLTRTNGFHPLWALVITPVLAVAGHQFAYVLVAGTILTALAIAVLARCSEHLWDGRVAVAFTFHGSLDVLAARPAAVLAAGLGTLGDRLGLVYQAGLAIASVLGALAFWRHGVTPARAGFVATLLAYGAAVLLGGAWRLVIREWYLAPIVALSMLLPAGAWACRNLVHCCLIGPLPAGADRSRHGRHDVAQRDCEPGAPYAHPRISGWPAGGGN